MFTEGTLFYITPFYFKTGGSKNKYFINFKDIDGTSVIYALPSSQDYSPTGLEDFVGCHNDEEKCLSFYCFSGKVITDTGFAFPKTTRIYWENLAEVSRTNLESRYYSEGVDFENLGLIAPDIMKEMIDCIRKSPTVRNRIKRLFK